MTYKKQSMKFREVVPTSDMSDEEREARWALWRAGDLSWKLKGCQNQIYDALVGQDEIVTTVLSSRRTGKSFTALIAEIEVCIQNALVICKHACPTQKMVKEMIFPQLRVIFYDAPPEFELDKLWNSSEGKLHFPNNSFISIAGTDGNNADNLRGTYCHFAVCDEAGFMDNLEYVVRQILRPQLLTTSGKLCLVSTPNPRVVNHEFHTKFVFPAEAAGKLIKFTIYDNTMLTPQQIQTEIDSYPKGVDDPGFRVEYMVEVPRSTEDTVVPEFYQNRNTIIFDDNTEDAPKIPEFCDFYVSGDIGVRDLTIYLFGYYNFLTAQLVILDEWVMNGMELTSLAIAEGIKSKESLRFVNPFTDQYVAPYRRVMDNDLKLINDLKILHGLSFKPTKKDNKRAAVNALRVFITEGRLKVHSRCKNLIYHVENAQWKETKSGAAEFKHLDASLDGDLKASHADGNDGLIYMLRNLDQKHNPYPYNPPTYSENQHISAKGREDNENKNTKKNVLLSMFGRKK